MGVCTCGSFREVNVPIVTGTILTCSNCGQQFKVIRMPAETETPLGVIRIKASALPGRP